MPNAHRRLRKPRMVTYFQSFCSQQNAVPRTKIPLLISCCRFSLARTTTTKNPFLGFSPTVSMCAPNTCPKCGRVQMASFGCSSTSLNRLSWAAFVCFAPFRRLRLLCVQKPCIYQDGLLDPIISLKDHIICKYIHIYNMYYTVYHKLYL